MEDVIQYILETNGPDETPPELPDEQLLARIEKEHGIQLPAGLREFLLCVGDVERGRLEPVTVTDEDRHTYLPELMEIAWDQGVPRDLIVLCEDEGDFYLVGPDGAVVLWRCIGEGGLTEDRWESVWDWARDEWLRL
ncbi:SMI1/KNR4 family protein [Streptomyces sp. TLI_105]|uniref:SMI1/KNR4 family protein n=1 Tax=Streptomyces sp. TLI_105 TaxID=1881019 RepID=UPI0008942F1C|nr:SMI1/KNR4 family protein [Streptomyces sp. TLI_105]SEE61858.1 SMI1-KNR4 cell-wall [Streptomyces sp. TLI_105]